MPDKGPLRGWARELSRRGFATLSFTLKGTVARRRNLDEWETEAKLLAPYGRPQMGILAEEALRAARVLGAQEQVDHARVGLTGFSLGSYAAWWAMACDPSIRTAAILCGGSGQSGAGHPRGDSRTGTVPATTYRDCSAISTIPRSWRTASRPAR